MFRNSDEYLEWDESGIPTVDAARKVVSKNRRKKLVKEWEKQKKIHGEWLSSSSIIVDQAPRPTESNPP